MPDLVRVSDVAPGFGRDLWALTLPELRSSSRVRAFMDHVVEALTERRDRMAGVPG